MKILTFTSLDEKNTLYNPIKGMIAVNHFFVYFKDYNHIRLKKDAMILLTRDDTLEGKKLLDDVFPGLKDLKEELKETVRKDYKKLNTPLTMIVKSGSYTIETLNREIMKEFKELSIVIEKIYDNIVIKVKQGYSAQISENLLLLLGFDSRLGTMIGTHVTNNGKFKALPEKISLEFKQIDNNFNEIDGQPSYIIATTDVVDGKGEFNPINPVFLPLHDSQAYHLEFRLYDEFSSIITPETFLLQLLNK